MVEELASPGQAALAWPYPPIGEKPEIGISTVKSGFSNVLVPPT